MANVELATAYITLVPSMKGAEGQITADLANVGAAAGTHASRGFLGTIGGAVSGVVGIAAGATAAIGGLVGGMAIKGGISRQLQIEDATAKLAGLGHGTDEVKTIMDNALASVKGTAFGLGEAGTVAAGAVAAGIAPGHDLQRILGLTADTATITGASMGEMGAIFNKVAANGKLTLGDVNQLQDRGFPILQMVAKQYGVTAAAASQMVTDGKVDFAHFADAIEAGVGGAALKSGDTTRGAFANMGAAISRFGVVLTAGFYPLAKVVFNGITDIFDGLNAKLKPLSTAWATTFDAAMIPKIQAFSKTVLSEVDKVMAVFELLRGGGGISEKMAQEFGTPTILRLTAFGDGVRGAGQTIYNAFDYIRAGWSLPPADALAIGQDLDPLVAFGFGVHAAGEHIVSGTSKVIGGIFALVAAFQAGGDDITSTGFAGVMEHIGLAARNAWDGAAPFMDQLQQGWARLMIGLHSGDFSGVGGNMVSIFGALRTIADPLGNVLVAVGSNIGSLGTAFGEVLAGALPLIAPILQLVADGLKFLAQHTEILLPLISTMIVFWGVYQAGVTAVNFAELFALPIKAASVAAQFTLAASNLALADATALAAGEERAAGIMRLSAVPRIIAQTAATVAHGIASGAVAVATGVATAAQWLYNAALAAGMLPLILIVVAIAAVVAGIVWLATQTTFFQDVWGAMTSFVIDVWNNLVSFLGSAWSTIVSVISTGMAAVGSFFAAGWNALVGFLAGVWANISAVVMVGVTAVVAPIVSGITTAWNFVVSIFTAIGSFIVGAWNWTASLVQNIMIAFWQTHGTQLTAIWNTVVSIFNNVMGFIVGVFTAIGGFFVGIWNWYVGIIVGAATAIWSFVSGIFNAVWGFIVGVFSAIGAAIAFAWNFYVAIVVGTTSAIWSVVSSVFNTVWSFIVGIFNAVSGFLGGVWNNIVGVISGAVNAVWGTISWGFSTAWNFIASVFGQVAGFLGGVWGNIVNGASGMIGNVVNALSGLGGSIMGALAGAGSWLYSAGVNIVEGLINGVQSLAGTIGNAFLNMVPGWIVGPFKAALGIASPSKLFHRFGVNTGEGYIGGAESMKGQISAAMRDLVQLPDAASISGAANLLAPQILSTTQSPAALAQSRIEGAGIVQNIYPQPGQSEELIGEYSMRQLSRAGIR